MSSLKKIGLIILFFSGATCNNVPTGSVSLSDVSFTAKIFGTYRWTDEGLFIINKADNIFPTVPTNPYTSEMIFNIEECGTLSAINNNFTFRVILINALDSDDNSAIYQIITPTSSTAGAGIKNTPYLKIRLDENTNVYFSPFTSTTNLANTVEAKSLVAQPSFIISK